MAIAGGFRINLARDRRDPGGDAGPRRTPDRNTRSARCFRSGRGPRIAREGGRGRASAMSLMASPRSTSACTTSTPLVFARRTPTSSAGWRRPCSWPVTCQGRWPPRSAASRCAKPPRSLLRGRAPRLQAESQRRLGDVASAEAGFTRAIGIARRQVGDILCRSSRGESGASVDRAGKKRSGSSGARVGPVRHLRGPRRW